MSNIQFRLLIISYILCSTQLFAQKSTDPKQIVSYKSDSLMSSNDLKLKFLYSEAKNGLITLVKINIFSKNTLIQTLYSNEYVYRYHGEKLIDYNFDGVNDISVCTDCGSGGCIYLVWLYSKKDHKYHYAKELSNRYGLAIDKKKKYILFNYWGGVGNEISDTLHYVNGKLRPIN